MQPTGNAGKITRRRANAPHAGVAGWVGLLRVVGLPGVVGLGGWVGPRTPPSASVNLRARALAVPRKRSSLSLLANRLRARICFLPALLAALLPASTRAHDRYEVWTLAQLRADYMEVAVTMAKGTALQLADPEAKLPALTPENFSAHRAPFDRLAPDLLVITAARKPLKVLRLETQLTEEGDIVFRLAYAPPAPGRLQVQAGFLKKLGPGYGGILEVSDAAGANLGWEQVSFEYHVLEITLPVPPPTAPPRP